MTRFADKLTTPPRSFFGRSRVSTWRQRQRSVVCPDAPRLDGQLALVTGGNNGIGLETAKGLARRGAEIIIASRNATKAAAAIEQISAEIDAKLHFVRLDLSDLASVVAATEEIGVRWAERPIDLLIANAGIWPSDYLTSAQGHELSFATNVLGHYTLIQRLLDRSRLAAAARLVILTGDVYFIADDCTSDFVFKGRLGGQTAYCRSKLGSLWLMHEFARRNPQLHVYGVHPGVVSTDLGDVSDGLIGAIRRATLLTLEGGAQMSLYCATQPNLVHGAYYHNVLGRMQLRDSDPGADLSKAAALWARLEELSADYR